MGTAFFYWYYNLQPLVSARTTIGDPQIFIVSRGEGFGVIVNRLKKEKLIRSAGALKLLALVTGKANDLKPGEYELSPNVSSLQILRSLIDGSRREVTVTIPEGSPLKAIDDLLSDNGIIVSGTLALLGTEKKLEGKLFPDTYRFFTDSDAPTVLEKILQNFEAQALPLLNRDAKHMETNLILASLIQKEVPDFEEARIVAGIMNKRVAEGVPLQIDATICYIKKKNSPKGISCEPITVLDLKADSPYNTYLHRGWPPGPIGSPGLTALKAALAPKQSPYWYYLSDPVTQKTIFARTLEEHSKNRFKYLNIH